MIFRFTNADLDEHNKNAQIRKFLQNLKEKFVDPDFPPIINSLGYSERISKWKDVKWLSINEFSKKAKDLVVYEENLSPSSVQQGNLGDCYFLSVLSALTIKPQLIKRLFASKKLNENGIYSVWLCLSGVWKNIVIDDYFPCSHGHLLFAKIVDNQIWPILLEKAFAKAYFCYEAIERGHTIEAINLITGAPSEYVHLERLSEGLQ